MLSVLPLSLPLWGVVERCRVDCVDAPCVGASPFPPTPSGVGLSCAASLVLRPPFTRVGREAACAVNSAVGECALCVSAPPLQCARGDHGVAWKARCLCHLPPGPSLPPCLPRSPSPCLVASCLTRWRCPWPSSRAKSINMRLLHPRAALSSHSGARSVARRRVHIHEHAYTALHEPDLTDQ